MLETTRKTVRLNLVVVPLTEGQGLQATGQSYCPEAMVETPAKDEALQRRWQDDIIQAFVEFPAECQVKQARGQVWVYASCKGLVEVPAIGQALQAKRQVPGIVVGRVEMGVELKRLQCQRKLLKGEDRALQLGDRVPDGLHLNVLSGYAAAVVSVIVTLGNAVQKLSLFSVADSPSDPRYGTVVTNALVYQPLPQVQLELTACTRKRPDLRLDEEEQVRSKCIRSDFPLEGDVAKQLAIQLANMYRDQVEFDMAFDMVRVELALHKEVL